MNDAVEPLAALLRRFPGPRRACRRRAPRQPGGGRCARRERPAASGGLLPQPRGCRSETLTTCLGSTPIRTRRSCTHSGWRRASPSAWPARANGRCIRHDRRPRRGRGAHAAHRRRPLFVVHPSTDTQPSWPLPVVGVSWWTPAPMVTGFLSGCRRAWRRRQAGRHSQLLLVARRRLAAECERLPARQPGFRDAVAAPWDEAVACIGDERRGFLRHPTATGRRPGILPPRGDCRHPIPWCVATGHSGFDIPLCPDPESRDEGVTPRTVADRA